MRGLRLTATLLGTVSCLAGGASAQTGSYLDQLISGSTSILPLRSIDTSVRAEKRYALVIGNGSYSAIPSLPNAQADAEIVADFLRQQDYIVQHHADITKRGFEDALRRILFDVDKDTEVVVFFAGHGFQIGSENYLVPVDADLDTVYDIPFETVSLSSLVSIVGARARLQVVILDSCRDNPFVGRAQLTALGAGLRETKTGFASLAAPLNSMLMYSTAPGALAFDGEGQNSPFTAALVEAASETPDAEIQDIFEGVRRTVYDVTAGRQIPWDSSTLIEPASFGIGAALSRPLAINAFGTGQTRGLARVVDEPEAIVTVSDAQSAAVIDAAFVPEVDIGEALLGAVAPTPGERVTVSAGPEFGRLILPGDDGRRQDVLGLPLSAEELEKLVLVNQSVQVPALSLGAPEILDEITISRAASEERIAIRLEVSPCDFHAGDHLDPDGMGITRYPNELEPEAALRVCLAAAAAEPGEGRFFYQLGRAHLALRDIDAAETAFETARDLGHSRAWYALGLVAFERAKAEDRVIEGRAPEDVLQFYARGTDEGDPYAFYSLGRQLLRFGGTDALEVEGYDLVLRSLEVGHTFAMNDLASFYLNPDNSYFDADRGLRYLRESASRGDIYGFNSLGIAHYRGRAGLVVDDAKAYELFLKASESGHPTAPFNIARMYRDGRAPEGEDLNRAVDWFKEALSRGHARSGTTAAEMILERRPAGLGVFDAAAVAAKSATLGANRYTKRAEDLLDALTPGQLDGGTQTLMVELGADLEVDGAFGPASREALERLLARYGTELSNSDPRARLIQLAELSWELNPFRVDLN
ncbi:MAG: caspase family protein [Pseudomonadota bacterium]